MLTTFEVDEDWPLHLADAGLLAFEDLNNPEAVNAAMARVYALLRATRIDKGEW